MESMPTSFNTLEAFFDFVPGDHFFRLFPERNHLVSALDFLDYVTGEADLELDLSSISSETIYHFDLSSDPCELTFETNAGRIFCVAGVSFVLHETEATVCLLLGEAETSKELEEPIAKADEGSLRPTKEYLEQPDFSEAKPVKLFGNEEWVQCLYSTRINLEENTHQERCLMQDLDVIFNVVTDSPNVAFDTHGKRVLKDSDLQKMSAKLDDLEPLAEACRHFLFLPAFFQDYSEDIAVEKYPTPLKKLQKSPKGQRMIKNSPRRDRVLVRKVEVLDRKVTGPLAPVTTLDSGLRVEVSGYWKRLGPGVTGVGKKGEPQVGRTWVEKRLTWVEPTSAPAVIRTRSSGRASSSSGANPGTLYVMRSAVHAKNVFKVGLTTRDAETRAAELSATTATPDHLHVVLEWEFKDCGWAEAEAHKRLAQYRVNPRREFFQVELKQIMQVILQLVEEEKSNLSNIVPEADTGNTPGAAV